MPRRLAELQDRAEILIRREDGRADPRLADLGDLHHIRQVSGVVEFDFLAVAQGDLVDDARRGRDEVEVELAREALLDDFQMQEPKEAAAEAEAERRRAFHLEGEARIVEAELAHRGAQFLEIRRIDREEPAEHHGLHRLEARQRLRGRLLVLGDGIADAGIRDFLDGGGDETHFAGREFGHIKHLRRKHADLLDVIHGIRAHHLDAHAFFHLAIDDADEHDDAEIDVIPAVDQQGLQRGGEIALGRRQARDDGLQHALDVDAGLRRNRHGIRGIEANHFLDLLLHPVRLGGGKVDLVEHRHDFMVGIERVIHVRERLRFHTLRRIHHEQRAFTGRE